MKGPAYLALRFGTAAARCVMPDQGAKTPLLSHSGGIKLLCIMNILGAILLFHFSFDLLLSSSSTCSLGHNKCIHTVLYIIISDCH